MPCGTVTRDSSKVAMPFDRSIGPMSAAFCRRCVALTCRSLVSAHSLGVVGGAAACIVAAALVIGSYRMVAQGGTFLGTARSQAFRTREGRLKAAMYVALSASRHAHTNGDASHSIVQQLVALRHSAPGSDWRRRQSHWRTHSQARVERARGRGRCHTRHLALADLRPSQGDSHVRTRLFSLTHTLTHSCTLPFVVDAAVSWDWWAASTTTWLAPT